MSDIAIYTNRVVPPWDPRFAADSQAPGLGGSEECVALLAAALAERHRVQVYASLPPDAPVPAIVDGVKYWPRESFDPGAARDVLITWKDHEPHAAYPRRARVALHWSSDVEPPQRWPAAVRARVDTVIALSAYHARRIAFLDPIVIPHGVPKRYVKHDGKGAGAWASRRPIAVYCSSPDRGLAYLLSHWPAIQRALGAEQLVVTYIYAPQGPLPAVPGVTYLGALPAARWDQLLAQARWWIHPVQGPLGPVPDAELFCLNAVKAQALGCMPIVPRALIETPLTPDPSPPASGGRGATAASGLSDTVKRTIDLSALIRAGETTVRDNPLAARDLPLTWKQVVDRYWEGLLRGDTATAPHPRPLLEGEG